MRIENVPFLSTDWSAVPATEHAGSSGSATWKTIETGNLRVRIVEYSAGYVADHWCRRGHVVLVLDGELVTEFEDGGEAMLRPGMSYLVAEDVAPHRSRTATGARLFIMD